MTASQQQNRLDRDRLQHDLYERYARPLEAGHWGAYVAISPRGETVIGTDIVEVAHEAITKLGKGHFLYKVGPRAVGKWR